MHDSIVVQRERQSLFHCCGCTLQTTEKPAADSFMDPSEGSLQTKANWGLFAHRTEWLCCQTVLNAHIVYLCILWEICAAFRRESKILQTHFYPHCECVNIQNLFVCADESPGSLCACSALLWVCLRVTQPAMMSALRVRVGAFVCVMCAEYMLICSQQGCSEVSCYMWCSHPRKQIHTFALQAAKFLIIKEGAPWIGKQRQDLKEAGLWCEELHVCRASQQVCWCSSELQHCQVCWNLNIIQSTLPAHANLAANALEFVI